MRDPFSNYDEWKLRSPEDEEENRNRILSKREYEEEHADDLYDRMKDEPFDKFSDTYYGDEIDEY